MHSGSDRVDGCGLSFPLRLQVPPQACTCIAGADHHEDIAGLQPGLLHGYTVNEVLLQLLVHHAHQNQVVTVLKFEFCQLFADKW